MEITRGMRWALLAALVSSGLAGCVAKQDGKAAPAARAMEPMQAMSAGQGALNTESYDRIVENSFRSVQDAPRSTFSIDVDTASYANVRRFLREGRLPPKDAVRIEELVNYFPYAYPQPVAGRPFSVTTEVGAAPWKPEHRLVHIGLQGRRLAQGQLPPRNLVFLLDVSGSMAAPDKLPLLQRSLAHLTRTLTEKDHVSIVVYAGASGLVLPPTSSKPDVLAALNRLEAGGSTNGGAGIELAYATAMKHFNPQGINRVILATDGDFNVGVASRGALERLIEQKRKSGVYLTVLGFGRGNLQDSQMEALADKGNGNYAYLDSFQEARKVLGKEAGATLVTIAKDVKIQVEFNPEKVAAYRLIGYENRRLKARDFNDDGKDAGEIGAGHSVTALYEVVPAGVKAPAMGSVDPLRYQKTAKAPSPAAHSGELLTVKLRYKAPTAKQSQLMTVPVRDALAAAVRTARAATPAFRFSAAVAAFGMLLRQSQHAGNSDYHLVRQLAAGARGEDRHGYRREFLQLVTRAEELRQDG